MSVSTPGKTKPWLFVKYVLAIQVTSSRKEYKNTVIDPKYNKHFLILHVLFVSQVKNLVKNTLTNVFLSSAFL